MTTGFGDVLRQLRRKTKKSQLEVAEELSRMFDIKMSQASVSTLEQRETPPRQDIIELLAQYYNVSVNYLLNVGVNEPVADEIDFARDYIRSLHNRDINIRSSVFARTGGKRSEGDDISLSLRNLNQIIEDDDTF